MSVRVLARSIAVLSALTAASVVQAQAKGHKAAAAEPNVAMGDTVGGIACDAQEGQRIHIHQHLVIFDHGQAVAIPPNVGQPAGKRCIYWLHTHTPDGIIHIEAPLDRSSRSATSSRSGVEPLTKIDRGHRRAPPRARRSRCGSTASRSPAIRARSRSRRTRTS